MSTDHIRYDLLVQDALRGVVRNVLTDAVKHGLPGEHHFYISFKTGAPGVRVSNRLREQYPDEMTIVLQHQYRDLGVTEHTFEVGLSFGGVPERLLVPYDAVVGFFDPSVQFGLKFEVQEPEQTAQNDDGMHAPANEGTISALPAPKGTKTKSSTAEGITARPKGRKGAKTEADAEVPPADQPGGAVVSLDAFRKKK
ncbi:MAG: SspB family protein [Beijerinckiaceae bacterium]